MQRAGLGRYVRRATLAPKIQAERKVGRWRADITLEWPEGPDLRLELKLCAGLTEAQRRTLKRHKGLVIHPHGAKPEGLKDHRTVTWKELASAKWVRDRAVRRLLSETDSEGTWQVERLQATRLRRDFREFLTKKGARGDWEAMWAFIATVDEKMLQLAPEKYRPGSWAMSRKVKPPYYGWWFKVRGQKRDWFWFGFEGSPAAPALTLTYHRSMGDYDTVTLPPLQLEARSGHGAGGGRAEISRRDSLPRPSRRRPARVTLFTSAR